MRDLFALSTHEAVPTKNSLRQVVTLMKADGIRYQEAVLSFRAAYIERILAKHSGHLGNAAVEIGIHRNTMTRTLRVVQAQLKRL